jgi:hypothetical protein
LAAGASKSGAREQVSDHVSRRGQRGPVIISAGRRFPSPGAGNQAQESRSVIMSAGSRFPRPGPLNQMQEGKAAAIISSG